MKRDDCVFVNLQYGDSRAERAELRDLAGIEIVDWPDLDLKNDAEGVFALMRCLDLVVTVRTTVNNMAAAVGTPVLLLIKEEHWSLLGQEQYPWFPGVHTVKVPTDQPVAAFLPWVKELLDGLVAP